MKAGDLVRAYLLGTSPSTCYHALGIFLRHGVNDDVSYILAEGKELIFSTHELEKVRGHENK